MSESSNFSRTGARSRVKSSLVFLFVWGFRLFAASWCWTKLVRRVTMLFIPLPQGLIQCRNCSKWGYILPLHLEQVKPYSRCERVTSWTNTSKKSRATSHLGTFPVITSSVELSIVSSLWTFDKRRRKWKEKIHTGIAASIHSDILGKGREEAGRVRQLIAQRLYIYSPPVMCIYTNNARTRTRTPQTTSNLRKGPRSEFKMCKIPRRDSLARRRDENLQT